MIRSFPLMPQNAQIDALAAMAQRIYGEIGRTLKLEGSGGAAEFSLAAGVFKPTLDGLSLVGGNAHTDREYAEVDSMVPRFYLLTRMVMELGRKPQSAMSGEPVKARSCRSTGGSRRPRLRLRAAPRDC